MSANSVKTKAFILRATKYGESDLIISALDMGGNRISLLARGALRSKKRFAGGILEPTHFVEIHYKQPTRDDRIAILNEAVLLDGFEALRKSYDKVELAFFLIETIAKVSQEGDAEDEGLFNLTGHSLRSLAKASNLAMFKLHFCLKLLFQQGTLEPESWMGNYLKTPMADHQSLESEMQGANADPQLNLHLIWSENKLREYLSTGMLSN